MVKYKSAIMYHVLHVSSPTIPRLVQRSTSPEQIGYVKQAINGPAAGCNPTHNERSKVSYWVHTQPLSARGKYDLWKIKRYEDCYKIKALDSSDGEHTRCKPIIKIYIIYHHELNWVDFGNFDNEGLYGSS